MSTDSLDIVDGHTDLLHAVDVVAAVVDTACPSSSFLCSVLGAVQPDGAHCCVRVSCRTRLGADREGRVAKQGYFKIIWRGITVSSYTICYTSVP